MDDTLLFKWPNSGKYLKFTNLSQDNNSVWAALMEKAWAKVKGNYLISEGGLVNNGIRALTGVPVFSYNMASYTNTAETDNLYNLIYAAD